MTAAKAEEDNNKAVCTDGGHPRPAKLKSELTARFLAVGLPVTFQDLEYIVVNNHNRREKLSLLKGVSGFLRPGEMSALMGPSGSGKSTLLDVLSMRKTVGTMSGEIRFGGMLPTKGFMQRYTGYVEQFDTLLGILSVEDMLMYTAQLKRPMNESCEQKKIAVDELIERLGLERCRHVAIGSTTTRGISGGQSKRVSIAIALVASPKVLFLDEPTSGLDSYTSNMVMSAVKSLAQMGMTVVTTIHSPPAYCFTLFDHLMLLLRGKVIYFGPSGQAAVDYFLVQRSSIPALQDGQNPAEYIVDVTTEADWKGMAEGLANAYAESELKALAEAGIQHLREADLDAASQKAFSNSEITTSFWHGLKTLLTFRTLNHYRSLGFMVPRVGGQLVFAFIMFTLYWKAGTNLSPGTANNLVEMLFMWTALAGFNSIVYTPSLVLDRPLFVREQHDGLYNVITFLVAKMIEELTITFLCSVAFSNLVFWTVKLSGAWVLFWLVNFCSLAVGCALAYFVAAMSPSMHFANMALPVYIACLLFFTGLLIRWDDIPNYWKWACIINFLRYSWGALMVNQFEGDSVSLFGAVSILDYYSLGGVSKWAWLGIEACFFFVFFTGAYLALRYMKHVSR